MRKSLYIKKKKRRLMLDQASGKNLAIINYDRGDWILKPINKIEIKINGKIILEEQSLSKEDIIEIEGKKLYWINYYYEGHHQALYAKDFLTINGRINKSNYSALFILLIGLIPCIYFSPGLFANIISYRKYEAKSPEEIYNLAENISIPLWIILGSVTLILFLIISIKRIRDAGYPIWNIFIPIKNIKILFFEESKKI